MERFLAIVNPVAGSGRCGKLAPAALSHLREGGIELDVVETSAPGDSTRIARDAYRQGRRHFIAVGGDGTTFEIVDGLFPEAMEGAPVSLGFLPLGTGNSFLRDFTDRGAEYTSEALIGGRSRSCDVVRLTHERGVLHFINVMSIGFTADICSIANRRFKAFGAASYAMGVFAKLALLKTYSFNLRLDGGETQDRPVIFIAFCNSRFTGGAMMMAPNADTADGQLDVVSCGQMGRLDLLRAFPTIFKGTHLGNPAVEAARTRAVAFDIDEEIDVVVDGEVLSLKPQRLDICPGVLEARV
jgi:YegS/Rv2252/BmrU family lipid kinase